MTDPVEVIARGMFQSDEPAPMLTHAQYHVYAQAALTALQEAGFVVAPVEPSEAMIAAGEFAWMNRKIGQDSGPLEDCYRAMISAAKGEE